MIKTNLLKRTIVVSIIFTALFTALAAKFYEVQISRHHELYEKAKARYTATVKQKGERGRIFDYEGSLLAGNLPCVRIIADPSVKTFDSDEKCKIAAEFFASTTGSDPETIFRRLSTKKLPDGRISKYALIADNVRLETAENIKKYIENQKWQGIHFEYRTQRYYPYDHLLANIIGFVNIDKDKPIPQSGIEQIKEKSMSSEDGKIIVERDRKGLVFEEHVIHKSRDGNDLYLTIYQRLQMIVEEELDNMMAKFSPEAAYAVMADPYTGNILAMAQRPTFNPNDRSTMTNPAAFRNRIAEDVFEPGSIMKPIPIAAAIDMGIVRPTDTFSCENGMWFYAGRPLRDAHPYGTLTVTEIIQKSSNIGTAKISVMVGQKRLYDTLRTFGFGQKTGIQMKNETIGLLRPLKDWSNLSVTRICIGQGIAVSPLQIVRAYCALANGGKLVSLRLIDREVNPETGESFYFPSDHPKNVFKNPETAKKIKEMLKLVTKKGGTAERAAVKGYDVAGKTGTSEKAAGGQYIKGKYHSSFVGFVPADNPAFVLLVTADEPKGAYYGGIVAAPSFKNIAEKALRALNVPPQYPEELEEEEKKETHAKL